MTDALVQRESNQLAHAGAIANDHAARNAFRDYLDRKANNTIRRQAAGLSLFAEFLSEAVGEPASAGDDLQHDPDAWLGITWGIVEAFVRWMLQQGYAVGSVNVRLSTIKTYAGLAAKAGTIGAEELAMIRNVSGYSRKEAKRINERREQTRVGEKKAGAVSITDDQTQVLKEQPNTAQGRRDRLLMCLLLDHGLRVSEVAGLEVGHFDLKEGRLQFYRPKVDKEQTHKLTADTLRAAHSYFDRDAPAIGPVLRSSRKDGTLTNVGMSTRAITERVRVLGEQVGIEGLSAHDCRHYWATYWAEKVDVLRLQEAGGWTSLAMPRRYVEEAKIANEGMA